ncbi:hypothetical protein ES703_66153 [subsurface metagenome]
MKTQRLLLLLGSVSLALILTLPFMLACTPATTTTTPTTTTPTTTTPTTTPPAKIKVVMASYPVEWGSYALSVGQADIVNRNSNVEIIVESIGGHTACVEAVETGYAPLTPGLNFISVSYAMGGLGPFADAEWAPAKNMRAVIASELSGWGFVTAPISGVTTIPDIKGKSIPSLDWLLNRVQFMGIMEAYGIDLEEDVTIEPITMSAAAWEEIVLGRIACTFDVINLALAEPQEAVGGQIVFLPIGEEEFNQAAAANPTGFAAASLGTIMPGDIPGVNMSGPVDIVMSKTIICGHVDILSDDVAYTIVKTLVEHYLEVQAISFGVSTFAPENAAPVQDICPYHPGAIQAYEELGLWTAEHEAANQRALEAIGG